MSNPFSDICRIEGVSYTCNRPTSYRALKSLQGPCSFSDASLDHGEALRIWPLDRVLTRMMEGEDFGVRSVCLKSNVLGQSELSAIYKSHHHEESATLEPDRYRERGVMPCSTRLKIARTCNGRHFIFPAQGPRGEGLQHPTIKASPFPLFAPSHSVVT